MSTQSIPPPNSDDAAAFHGNLHITNPWYSLDLDSFQLLAGVHVPAHFAARLPASTIGQASTTPSTLLYGSAGSHSPPRGASVRLCRDDPNCTREDCYFAHTNKATMAPNGRCSYGSRCTRNGCALSHDDIDEETISPTSSPSFKSLVNASTLSVHAPVFELNDDIVISPPSTGRYPKSIKSSHNYYDDATTNASGTGAGVVSSSGYWNGNGRRTSPTSTPTSRSPTRSTSPTSLATIPRPVNVTPMRRVNVNGSHAPTMGGRSDTANAWTTVRRSHRHHSNGSSPSRSRGHWHQQHSNTMVSVSA